MVCTWGSSYCSLCFCRGFNFSVIKSKKKKKAPKLGSTPQSGLRCAGAPGGCVWGSVRSTWRNCSAKLVPVNSGGPSRAVPGPGEMHQIGSLVRSLPLHQTSEKDRLFSKVSVNLPWDPVSFHLAHTETGFWALDIYEELSVYSPFKVTCFGK